MEWKPIETYDKLKRQLSPHSKYRKVLIYTGNYMFTKVKLYSIIF